MKYLQIILLLCASLFANAQEITTKKNTLSLLKFYQEGTEISKDTVKKELADLPEALAMFSRANTSMNLGTLASVVGGLFMGFPIGTAIGGGDPKWELAGAGLGLYIVGVSMNSGGRENAIKAIDIFNEANGYTLNQHRIYLEFGYIENGLGLAVKF